MPTLGEQLKQAREARKLTIKQAVLATRVRAHYIEAMEADDFAAMPSAAQARGFLRLYADYLGLDSETLISRQRAESEPAALPPAEAELAAPQPAPVPATPAPAATATPLPAPPAPTQPEPEPEPEPEIDPGPPPASQTIFDEIGASLRQRRELLSLTLEEIERHTRVRKHYLSTIENGAFDDLPSPVQARGMLSAYAGFLDMDTEAILLRFADALQARRIERQPALAPRTSLPRAPLALPLWLRRFISPDLIFGGSMILIILGLSIWGAARLLSGGPTAEAAPTEGPSISEVLLATPIGGEATPTEELLPTSVAELVTSVPTEDIGLALVTEAPTDFVFVPASAVQITVVVVERTFLRVTVDGEVKQEGRVAAGAALTFDGNERIEVLTGSGAAIQIVYNQQNLGILGNFGEVVNRIYTINGVETPTPTPSPTPSNTPRVQPSPSPTLTPSSTPTLLP